MFIQYLKKIIIYLFPPVVLDFIKFFLRTFKQLTAKFGIIDKVNILQYGFNGIFHTWEEAANLCGSYDSKVILEKCKNSLLKVKRGAAVYERDSVIFDEIQYSWPLLASLMYVAAKSDGELKILDFGGSLGSSYYQNRLFLKGIKNVSWNIVEQEEFVKEGKLNFQDENLFFYESIDSCIQERNINVFLASSSLPYIKDPFSLIKTIIKYDFPYILIDRTYFIDLPKSIVSAQRVPSEIYEASYPAWFFNFSEFVNAFSGKYKMITTFDSYLQASSRLNSVTTREMGMFFEIKK
ncbi:methyltransferase, TIGR04325 family [Leptospira yasudae]|uniref:methyltransferase, TIGR04325 family n=1 Tax=Leptospira yasudae TaxID=2202201 RepID=UPI000E59F442|nr:methyltransferase, TIGR04325 family [Leptospira yasudae]RHX91217.1 methyltransferase, TIGR04325 family [Leptospira yasudae]